MKKLLLISVAFGLTNVLKTPPVFPGTFAFIVLNQNANLNVDDRPGWNWTSLTARSMKTNPLYVDGTVTPLIAAKIPCNFATAQEAFASYVAGTFSVAY